MKKVRGLLGNAWENGASGNSPNGGIIELCIFETLVFGLILVHVEISWNHTNLGKLFKSSRLPDSCSVFFVRVFLKTSV